MYYTCSTVITHVFLRLLIISTNCYPTIYPCLVRLHTTMAAESFKNRISHVAYGYTHDIVHACTFVPKWPKDNKKLIISPLVHTTQQQQKILADLDKQRHEEFRQYEMQMEHRRREKLREMDNEHRAQAEKQFEEMQKKMREHESLRHPASKEQLEDVWEHQDGLTKDEFDPKTFFHLHDKNGDRHLDSMELEALFYSEVRETK